MATSIAFWMSNAGIPILTFLLNLISRILKKLPISAGADWVLILWAFDLVVMINHADYLPHIVEPIIRDSLFSIIAVMIIMGIAFWIYCIQWLEPALDKIRNKKKKWGWNEILQIIVAISLVCLDTWAHFSVFSFKQMI